MAKLWAEMTISEKLDSLHEQLGEILDELQVADPDAALTCGHLSLDAGRNVDGHLRSSALGQKNSVLLSIVRH
jgi:hypothetical protein